MKNNQAIQTLAPFIDAPYYNEIYKPNKSARIEGSFLNVDIHKANFDAFRNRASEIVDRLLGNKITAIGGIAFAGELAQATIKKATAAFVEHWYLKGFIMSDLNSTLSLGNLSANQLVSAKSFREIAPLSALTLIQKSGMWDNKIIGVDLIKELADNGIQASEIVTWGDALTIFEEKGMGLNFHIEGDLEPILTNQPGIIKYVKIASTDKKRISLEILGGSDTFTKNLIEVVQDAGVITKAEAFVWSQDAITQTADFYTKYEDGKMGIYMSIPDDISDKILAISNVFPDQTGEYGVLGSLDNSDDLSLMSKLSVIGNVSKLDLEISTAELNLVLPKFGLSTIPTGTIPVTDYSESLTEILGLIENLNLELTDASGATITSTLKNAIQELSNAIGSYSNDDPNNELNNQLSVIRNITIIAENLKAALLRISSNETRISSNETSINNNITEIGTIKNDAITLSDRVAAIETSTSLLAKEWNGDVQLQNNGVSLLNLVANDGLPFEFKAGDKLAVSIKHSQDNAGVTQTITIGNATPKIFVIPTGNQSDSLAVQIATTGSLTASVVNGNDTVTEFALYELVEEKKAIPSGASYTKAESDTLFYSKTNAATEKARVDNELAKKATIIDTQTKADATTEKSRVDTELTKKIDTTTATAELAKKADITTLTAELAKKENNYKWEETTLRTYTQEDIGKKMKIIYDAERTGRFSAGTLSGLLGYSKDTNTYFVTTFDAIYGHNLKWINTSKLSVEGLSGTYAIVENIYMWNN